jgi:hypothetical protein
MVAGLRFLDAASVSYLNSRFLAGGSLLPSTPFKLLVGQLRMELPIRSVNHNEFARSNPCTEHFAFFLQRHWLDRSNQRHMVQAIGSMDSTHAPVFIVQAPKP